MKDKIIIYQADKAATPIENLIFTVREQQVMLDFHLAQIYEMEIKRLNEQVKRNIKRFPDSFMFQLNTQEWEILRSQFATLKLNQGKHRKYLPYAFTEQGVAMLSSVLNSDYAIQVSIQIMKAFVNMRKFLLTNASLFQRVENLEQKQLQTDGKINQIFKALDTKTLSDDKGIFFNGQIFDAYVFVSEIIKKARKSIVDSQWSIV
jgi:phage regulator Rha-like protein